MKKFIIVSILLVIVGLMALTHCAKKAEVVSQDKLRAAKGDTVWIILNHVKPDKLADFENFHIDILNPIMDNLTDPLEKENFAKVRFLSPGGPDSDGTLTYIYMMDPYARGKTKFLYFLNKKYSEEESQAHYATWKNSLDRPQEGARFVEMDYQSTGELNRASEGDTVWVLLNRIKPGKEADFERFMYDIALPAMESDKDPVQLRAFHHARLLKPVRSHDDGSSTYLFLMDPYVPGADMGVRSILSKYYSEDQVSEYISLFSSCYQESQTGYSVIQTEY